MDEHGMTHWADAAPTLLAMANHSKLSGSAYQGSRDTKSASQNPEKLPFRWKLKPAYLAILICLPTLVFAQTARAGADIIDTCAQSAFSPRKGAFYAYSFASGGNKSYCWGAYAESAQGACDDVLSQVISAYPPGSIDASRFSPASPASKIGYWGSCGSAGWLLQLRAPKVETFTITLSGGTEVEPSKGSTINTLPFIATVIDKNTNHSPSRPVTVRISLKVDPRSGGHDHGTSDRPRGGVANVQTCPSDDTCWSWTSPTNNGVVVFNFNAPEASGTHTITATCDGCSNATANVNVKVKESDAVGWGSLTTSPAFVLVGGETNKPHHDNHYLTSKAKLNLLKMVREYNDQYPAGPLLHLNDASLEWGGKFDVDHNVPWLSVYATGHPRAGNSTPHVEHKRGDVIDIRANQDVTAIPVGRFIKFEQIAARAGASAKLHCAFSGRYACPACELDLGSNRHYHVYLVPR